MSGSQCAPGDSRAFVGDGLEALKGMSWETPILS